MAHLAATFRSTIARAMSVVSRHRPGGEQSLSLRGGHGGARRRFTDLRRENIDIWRAEALIRRLGPGLMISVTIVVGPAAWVTIPVIAEARRGPARAPPRSCVAGLAAKATARTASYDAAIAAWFAPAGGETFPRAADDHHRRARCQLPCTSRRSPASAGGDLLPMAANWPGIATARMVPGQRTLLRQHRRRRSGLRMRPSSRSRPSS